MKKLRHYPEKKQNNYGGDYDCLNYDVRQNGTEFCHDEVNFGFSEYIKWAQTDEHGKLKCKGNRHNCFKMKQKWLASLSETERNKYFKK